MVGVLVLIFKLFIAFEKVSLDWKAVNNTPLFKKMREPEFRKLTDKSVITGKMLDAIMKYIILGRVEGTAKLKQVCEREINFVKFCQVLLSK